MPDLACTECPYIFTEAEVAAEDKSAWGHPCHGVKEEPKATCESFRKPSIGWHEFVPGTICNFKMCARCDERYEHPVHHTGVVAPTEETERILKRRRAVMPDYDRKLEEWLS